MAIMDGLDGQESEDVGYNSSRRAENNTHSRVIDHSTNRKQGKNDTEHIDTSENYHDIPF
jgi:hypothetical protein